MTVKLRIPFFKFYISHNFLFVLVTMQLELLTERKSFDEKTKTFKINARK